MKKLSYFLCCFGIAFLFYFPSEAALSITPCEAVIRELPSSKSIRLFPIPPEKPDSVSQQTGIELAVQNETHMVSSLISHILYSSSLNGSAFKRLDEQWKNQVIEMLPHFSRLQLLDLLTKLASQSNEMALNHERVFFKSLEKATLDFIFHYDKNQLVMILWVFIQLDIKPLQDEFIHFWRKAAVKRRQEFTHIDRLGLRNFFHQLDIPPRLSSTNGVL